MSSVLEGLQGIVCHMDDTLIHGPTQEVHDTRVRLVLNQLSNAGIKLNNKCEFSKHRIIFLGHVISDKEVEADPKRTKAVQEFWQPSNVKELQRSNGIVNQLAKFIPELASINGLLRQLLRKGNQLLWDQPQEKAFLEIKQKLTSPDVLAHYDASKRSVVAADACQDGLGAVPFQTDSSGNRCTIAFASRSPNNTEKRYAVIEKGALAAIWACEKFNDYIQDTEFTLETDHWPLVPLLQAKTAQEHVAICKQVKTYFQDGWPPIILSQPLLKPYWEKRQHLTVTQELLMYNNQVVIPQVLQLEMLNAIHEGHLGITKCQGCAAYSIW